MKYRILLVEDDDWLAQLYQDVLQSEIDYEVTISPTAELAFRVLDGKIAIDLVLLDMFLPDHNGVEFLHELASYSDTVNVPIFVLSTVPEQDFTLSRERWQQYGVVGYLYKPQTKPQDLLLAIKKYRLVTASV